MPVLVVYSEELSRMDWNTPSAADINAAVRRVNMGGGNWGAWVGPSPRITRTAPVGTGFITHVAAVYSIPDNAWTQQHGAYIRARLVEAVTASLRQVSNDFSQATLSPFAVAINGPLSWWTSGQAAVTQTRDEFPLIGGRLDPNENPIGPTSAATHPGTASDALSHAASAVGGRILWPLAAIGAVVIAVTYRGQIKRMFKRGTRPATRTAEAT